MQCVNTYLCKVDEYSNPHSPHALGISSCFAILQTFLGSIVYDRRYCLIPAVQSLLIGICWSYLVPENPLRPQINSQK